MTDGNSNAEKRTTTVADPSTQQLAAVYAQALLNAAESAAQTGALVEELDSLVTDVLDVYPQLEATLNSGVVSHDKKEPILDRVFGTQASTLLLNFLKVLSQRGRFDLIRPVCSAVHELYSQMRGRVEVEVRTAIPVDRELIGTLSNQLRGMLGSEPQFERVTDPAMIGGIVLRIGDTVYDGSVSTQLKRMRGQLIDRSVHEIQSRRDRFRDPAGD